MQQSREAGEGRKLRRDPALTWEVPPELERDFVRTSDASTLGHEGSQEAGELRGESGAGPPVHALVTIQRQAFSAPAQQHLRAIVSQLLTAHDVTVRSSLSAT